MPFTTRIIHSVFSILLGVSVVTAGTVLAASNAYIEDFTSTTFRDSVNTTAEWDTTAGHLRIAPFVVNQVGMYDTPGLARGIAYDGIYAYVADQLQGLQIIDISDHANPTLLGTYDTPGSALGVAADGDRVLVADSGSGLLIIDVTDPTAPSLLGSYDTPGFASDVAVAGDAAYVADYSGDLQVINITNPALPSLLGTYATAGNVNAIEVDGDLAFLVAEGFGLKIVDISDPANPSTLGSFDTAGNALGVAVDGDFVFVADGSNGLVVVDIETPTAPSQIGNYNTTGIAYEVTVDGDRVVVADGGSGIQVIDVTDPTNPTLDHTYGTVGQARDVALDGALALIAADSGGLKLVQVSTSVAPRIVGAYSFSPAYRASVAGNYLYMANGFRGFTVLDVSDPQSPILAGSYPTPTDCVDGVVSGDHAFLVDGTSFTALDISDPTTPTKVDSILVNARAIHLSGDLAYLAAGSSGLYIIDISDPANLSLLGIHNTPSFAVNVVVVGDLAYVSDSDRVEIIDVSDPLSPASIGSYDTPGAVYSVALAGNLAYVADFSSGLQIIDIADPTTPTLVGTFDTPGRAFDVGVSGQLAYVADDTAGLQVIDISNPSTPTLAHSVYTLGNNLWAVSLVGDHLYIGDVLRGLWVFQVFQDELAGGEASGQSTDIVNADPVVRARISALQTGNVTWELKSGINYTSIPLDMWVELTGPSTNLRWRSTHAWDPGVNPTVTELTVEWLNDFARVASVTDIPGDQGLQVRLAWRRSGHDFAGDASQIMEYAIYRRVDEYFAGGVQRLASMEQSSLSLRAHAASMAANGWDYVASVPARGEDDYSMVVPTLVDSSFASGLRHTTYRVSALTAAPTVFFDSPPDSGYSIDNLAPGVPQSLTAAFNQSSINLVWDEAPEPDFQYFRVYRGTDPEFDPSSGTLIGETSTPNWQDSPTDPSGVYYKVTALDFAGNESAPAASGSVTGIQDGPASGVFVLRHALPNPLSASTRIQFFLPQEVTVSLEIFDTNGRLVRALARGSLSAGTHERTWDGTDASGRRVSAGVYLYRLRAGSFQSSRRIVVMQ